MAPITTLQPPDKAYRKPKTRGRITRGRIIPAKRISERTLVWPGLRERIAAEDALSKRTRGSGVRGSGGSASATPPTSTPTTPEEDGLPDDMLIYLESSTDDILPTEFHVPRWDCIDFAALKFIKRFELGGTCTLHLGQEVVRQSKRWTAADVGLNEGDTIDVRFWL